MMSRGKEKGNILREATVAVHLSVKDYKTDHEFQTIWSTSVDSENYSQRTAFNTVVSLPRCVHPSTSSRSHHATHRETQKAPRATFLTPKASLSMLNVKDYDTTIRRKLKNVACQQKELESMTFTEMHLNKPQDLWNNTLGTNYTKVELFCLKAQCHVSQKLNRTLQQKHLIHRFCVRPVKVQTSTQLKELFIS